jgi:hypothetical protein
MTLAWFMGAGYSFENVTTNLPEKYKQYEWGDVKRYSHTYFGDTFPMIFTGGLTIGYILPAPKWIMSKKVAYNKPPTRRSMND